MTEKKKMGRKRIEFNWELLDDLCAHTMHLADCAEIMKCSEDTIQRRVKEKTGDTFAVYRNKKLAKTRLSLVQRALQMAKSDKTMLIFCLKNLNKWQDQVAPDPQPIDDLSFED